MKRIILFITLIGLLAISASAQDSLHPALAKFLVDGAIGNSKIIPHKNVFILNEANIHTLRAYQKLERDSFISMTLTDTSYCCETYEVELLPKSNEFKIDSIPEEGSYKPLVLTFTYDSLEIIDVLPFEGYYEIKYKVINTRPTPFYIPSPRFPMNSTYESSCFVRKINDDWQIDKNNKFYGFPDENGKY